MATHLMLTTYLLMPLYHLNSFLQVSPESMLNPPYPLSRGTYPTPRESWSKVEGDKGCTDINQQPTKVPEQLTCEHRIRTSAQAHFVMIK